MWSSLHSWLRSLAKNEMKTWVGVSNFTPIFHTFFLVQLFQIMISVLGLTKRRQGLIFWAKISGRPVQPGLPQGYLCLVVNIFSPLFAALIWTTYFIFHFFSSLLHSWASAYLLSRNSHRRLVILTIGTAGWPRLTTRPTTVVKSRESWKRRKESGLVFVSSSFLKDVFDRCVFNIFGWSFSSFTENRYQFSRGSFDFCYHFATASFGFVQLPPTMR